MKLATKPSTEPPPLCDLTTPRLSLTALVLHCITTKKLVECRAVVGELDEDLDKELDLGNTRAAPLKAIHA